MSNDLLKPGHTHESVTERISGVVLTKHTPLQWFAGFAVGFALLQLLLISITYLFVKGVGIWGLMIPVGWGFDIINFVWWIGIGHAGTLISAILLLLHQDWRNSINRFAEAMTLFAVACAGIYPLIHVGRPWLAYFLFPLPNTMNMWPQFRSPLMWDVVAVSTYASVSAVFWYVGLIPDLASLRDRAKNKVLKVLYGLGALGWRGSAQHWKRYQTASLLLAGLSAPLVVSVHTVVSFDFAVSLNPGWHTTVFPPYFVAGAVYSGFAMVLTLTIPLRKLYNMTDFITDVHLDKMAKVMLATGLIVAYGYAIEIFTAWYSGNLYEHSMIKVRMLGPYAPFFWSLIAINVLMPQMLWFRSIRYHAGWLFVISIFVNIGMWLERFIIIVTSLHRDFLPSSWDNYVPSFWDISTFIGTIGLFLTLLFIFMRLLPMITIFEVRELITHDKLHNKDDHK